MDDPFLVSVDAFIAKAKARNELVLRAIAEDVLFRIKQLTPVRTGYLRSNWTIVRGQATVELSGDREQASLAVILQLRAGDTFTILNPVVYCARVEAGFTGEDSLGRHYDQKGAHMMQQTITELPQIAAAAIARVVAGG